MKAFLNNKGETLAETIVALSILAIGITVASTIMINSTRNLTNAKNRVVAVNIAREGIEAVRNIRDSNWLFYSDRRRACWNHVPSIADCDGSTPIAPGTYIVYKDSNNSWKLANVDTDVATDDDLDGIDNNDIDSPDMIQLSLVDIDALVDSDGKDPDSSGDGQDDDLDFYNHTHVIALNTLAEAIIQPTPFSRFITIEYLENEPSGDSQIHLPNDAINSWAEWDALDDNTEKTLLNRMRITSTVQWTRGTTHTAELTTIISDHLGRESLGN